MGFQGILLCESLMVIAAIISFFQKQVLQNLPLMILLNELECSSYNLFIDNWYSSIALIQDLRI